MLLFRLFGVVFDFVFNIAEQEATVEMDFPAVTCFTQYASRGGDQRGYVCMWNIEMLLCCPGTRCAIP